MRPPGCSEGDAPAVAHPDGRLVFGDFRREAGQCPLGQLIDPDVNVRLALGDHDVLSVGRQARLLEDARGNRNR